MTYVIAAKSKNPDCAAFFLNWAWTNEKAREIDVAVGGASPGGPPDGSVPSVPEGSVTAETLAAGAAVNANSGAMDFIANATSSIFFESWTPDLQKLVGGTDHPRGAPQERPGALDDIPVVDSSDSRIGKLALMSAPASPSATSRRTPRLLRGVRRDHLVGWLFVVPALAFYAMFVLQPLVLSFQYSFYDWNGVGVATWVGLDNYATVFSDEELLNAIFNAFKLIFFFSVIPVTVGLVTASIIRGAARGRFGTVSRTVLFLPQVIPLVAAGIMWNWVLAKSGTVNQILTRGRARWDHQGVAR